MSMCRFSKSCSISQSTSNSTMESFPDPRPRTRSPRTRPPWMRPPTSFYLFSNLPAEIKLKIWNFSILKTPRIVRVHVVASPNQDVCDRVNTLYGETKDYRACRYTYHEYVPTLAIPIHLQVCFESRLEALKHYQRGLTSKIDRNNHFTLYSKSTQCRHQEETYTINRPFYFSPEVDVIFITSQDEWHDSPELIPVSSFDKLSDIWVSRTRFIQVRILCMTERQFTEMWKIIRSGLRQDCLMVTRESSIFFSYGPRTREQASLALAISIPLGGYSRKKIHHGWRKSFSWRNSIPSDRTERFFTRRI